METGVVKSGNQKISEQVLIYSPDEIAIIKATVAKGFSDLELSYFLNVAKVYGLNPFTKQIWGYKDNKKNIIVFAGRDGFLSIAQKTNRWSGIASCEVREGEKFEMNVAEGIISHQKDITSKAKILGAYSICKPRNCDIKTIEWADFDTYNKGYNVWKSDPVAMIKKVAESHCLAKAYGISGLAIEEDFQVKDDVAYVGDHETRPSVSAIGYADNLLYNCTLDEDTKCLLEKKLCDQSLTNSELEEIINQLKENQPAKY
jgi:phage recombination protein Bet